MQAQDNNIQTLTKLVNSVQGNCEYLTTIKSNLTNRTNIARTSYSTLESYLKDVKIKINIQSIIHLYIQLAYFLYACKNQGVRPIIQPEEDLRIQEIIMKNSQKRFMLVLWYKFSEQKIEDGQAIEIYNNLFSYIKDNILSHLQMYKGTSQKDQLEQIQCFYSQYDQIINKNVQQNQSLFFLCLQQTYIFFEHSILYRIKNCSILDYIKTDETRLNKLKIAKSKDQSSVIEYNKQKSRNRNDQEILRNKQKQIQNNINIFFKSININEFYQLPNKNQKDQIYRVKFYYIIHQRQKIAFQDILQNVVNGTFLKNDKKVMEYKKRQLAQLEFFIQYSSEKNHIGVKLYMPNVCVNIQTSDFLMFQSNVLTFDAVNVSIELSQPRNRTQDKASNKKVVTFKSSSSFNIKEPPLQKILLLMDITMIASRIYEPELNPNRYNSTPSKDYLKISTISKKISHYTKLFMKCAKKIYNQ